MRQESGVEEVNFTFEGHRMARIEACASSTTKNCRAGDVSLE